MQNSIRNADLHGDPGLNKPGDLDSFNYETLNPYGRTSLDDIESPLSRLGKSIQDKFKPKPADFVPGPTYPAIQPMVKPEPTPGASPVPGEPNTSLTKVFDLETLLASSTADIDSPINASLLSSGSKAAFTTSSSPAFLEPMSSLDTAAVMAELAPTNEGTGVDDGAISVPFADDAEQSLINNDGDPSGNNAGQVTPALSDDKSFLNDDGLG
jgi:hypothetical protein